MRRARAIGFAAALLGALVLAAPAAGATHPVTSSSDSGAGSLRDAVAAASSGDVVEIAAGVNPVLSSGEIVLDKGITIRGRNASSTTVSAGRRSRIFRVTASGVEIEDLALTAGAAARGSDGGSGLAGSAGQDGGAILNEAGASLTLRRMVIANSSAGNGGNGGDALLPIVLGAGAGGAGGHGGAIASFGSLSAKDMTFAVNRAGTGGAPGSGGLSEPAGGAGGNGGAIFVAAGGGRTTRLENVTIARNGAGDGSSQGAAGRGGALFADGGGASGSIRIVNATISENRAGRGASQAGGGIAAATSAGALVVQNSILAANSATSGANCSGQVGDGSRNIAFPSGGCPSGFSTNDPKLDSGGLADNGGPTPTIAIGGGPALNQVPASGANCPATDQRGVSRPQGNACDIGAYEIRAPSCQDVSAKTRPGRQVRIRLTCSGPGGVTLATKSDPQNGKLSNLKPRSGTVKYTAGRRFRGTDTFTYSGTSFVGESASARVTINVGGPLPPPNRFRFGKVATNRNKGTAKLTVRVPGPGKIQMSGKGVRNVKRKVGKKKQVTLAVKPTKQARRKLKRSGVVTVRAKVRYTPRGGFPRSRTKKVRLRTNSFFVPIKL